MAISHENTANQKTSLGERKVAGAPQKIKNQWFLTIPSSPLIITVRWASIIMRQKMKSLFILVVTLFVSSGILISPAHAIKQSKSIKIKNVPRPFSAIAPTSWVQRATSTGNSRIKFAAPSNTPSAECAVIVTEYPALKNMPQSTFDQGMIEEPNPGELATQLAASYNNVKVLSASKSSISGFPAQIFNVQYSVGTPNGELWARGMMVTTATTPGLMWTISCGGLGFTPEEAKRSYSYWQLEINNFPTNIKIEPSSPN